MANEYAHFVLVTVAPPVSLPLLVVYDLKYTLWGEVENISQIRYAFTICVPSANNLIPCIWYLRDNLAEFKQPLSHAR